MPAGEAFSVPGLLNDVLATDGSGVFIRQMNVTSPGDSAGRHLFTTAGYLDSSWFNRTFWKVRGVQTTGIMVLGQDVAYGVEIYPGRSRETVFTPGAQGYRLTCYSLTESAKRCGVAPRGYLREATLGAVGNPGTPTLARDLESRNF